MFANLTFLITIFGNFNKVRYEHNILYKKFNIFIFILWPNQDLSVLGPSRLQESSNIHSCDVQKTGLKTVFNKFILLLVIPQIYQYKLTFLIIPKKPTFVHYLLGSARILLYVEVGSYTLLFYKFKCKISSPIYFVNILFVERVLLYIIFMYNLNINKVFDDINEVLYPPK